jgi:N-acetylneuraminic acid mutarotase
VAGKPAAAIYDATTNTWRPAAAPPIPIFGATVTALQDGTVLLAGGEPGPTTSAAAFLFEPDTNRWVRTGDMVQARSSHSATLLRDGRVLVVGGEQNGQSLASSEVYDPRSRSWSLVKTLPRTRVYQTAVLLSDGRVMIAGGDVDTSSGSGGFQLGTSPGSNPYFSEEVYDPRSDTWSELSAPTTAEDPSLLPLRDGRLLFYGGHFGKQPSDLTFIYDPRSRVWSKKASAKGFGIGIELTDGRVFFPEALWTYDPSQDLWMPATQVPQPTGFASLPLMRPDGKVLTIENGFSQPHPIGLVFDAGGFPPLPGSSGPLANSNATRVFLILAFALIALVAARYLVTSRRSAVP